LLHLFWTLFFSGDQEDGQSGSLNQKLTEVECCGEENPRRARKFELVTWRVLFLSDLQSLSCRMFPRFWWEFFPQAARNWNLHFNLWKVSANGN